MLFTSLLSLVTLTTTTLALPSQARSTNKKCLTDSSAYHIASNFKTLITNYSNASAAAYLTPDFTDYSDSVNTLINSACTNGPKILGSATFTGLEDFQAGQGGQPNIPFEILNVWHGCSSVTMRWRSSAPGGSNEQQVTGLVVMETVCNKNGGGEEDLIKTVYSEFNSGAWLVDLGVFVPSCGA